MADVAGLPCLAVAEFTFLRRAVDLALTGGGLLSLTEGSTSMAHKWPTTCGAAHESHAAVWAAVVMAVLLLPWMVATGAINAATRGLLELRKRALDERQSAERARVQAGAHRAMTLLLVTAAAGLLIAGAADGDAPTAYAAPVLIAVLAVHWLMPLWMAGLMAQDEPAEDDSLAA